MTSFPEDISPGSYVFKSVHKRCKRWIMVSWCESGLSIPVSTKYWYRVIGSQDQLGLARNGPGSLPLYEKLSSFFRWTVASLTFSIDRVPEKALRRPTGDWLVSNKAMRLPACRAIDTAVLGIVRPCMTPLALNIMLLNGTQRSAPLLLYFVHCRLGRFQHRIYPIVSFCIYSFYLSIKW
jgi:hypothetical protein